MGQILPFSVETLDAVHHSPHVLADFARLDPARRAARLSLEDDRVTLAVVRDRSGRMVYAVDRRREWEGVGIPSNG